MKSFLLKNGKPIISWSLLPDNVLYKGSIPKGYDLAVCPHSKYIIVDVDRHGDKDGFKEVPSEILSELAKTFSYPTKNNGKHYWLYYTGSTNLLNKASGLGIDLRVAASKKSNGGYVKWHPRDTMCITECLNMINSSSMKMNEWLIKLFGNGS